MRRALPLIGAVLAALLAVSVTHTLAQPTHFSDDEPNNTCATAEDLGALDELLSIAGAIDPGVGYPEPTPTPTVPAAPAVTFVEGEDDTIDSIDFFSLTATAGTQLLVELRGAPSNNGTLPDPLLGAFDSPSCSLLATIDDSANSLESIGLVTVPENGILVLAVTAYPNFSFTEGNFRGGSYTLTVRVPQLISSIDGSLLDSVTGEPPTDSAFVELQFCGDDVCNSVASMTTYDGNFGFFSSPSFPLSTGDYQIRVISERYVELITPRFKVDTGEDKHLEPLVLSPLPLFNSLSGRLVNALTKEPLSDQLYGMVNLVRCSNGYCADSIASVGLDAGGNFRFDATTTYRPLVIGDYMVTFNADQYQPGSYGPFSIGASEDMNLNDLDVQPNPVQFFNPQGCPEISARGGACRYRIEVVNGLDQNVWLKAWSLISTYGASNSSFQPDIPQTVHLRPGERKTISFTLFVPAAVPAYTAFCGNVYVANRGNGFYFQPLGSSFVFCSAKGADGVTRQIPRDEARELMQRGQSAPVTPHNGK